MNTDSIVPERARAFHLADELRRSAMWAICGCFVIGAVGSIVGPPNRQQGMVGRVVFVVVLCGIAAGLSQYLFARIRVDQTGISRRNLWWWDLWSWEQFSAGAIRLGFTRHSYEDPDRPWYRRSLNLGHLNQDDAEALDVLIRRVWTPPRAAAISDALRFRFNWPDRREVQLTAKGITISQNGRQDEYRWNEVQAVEIWRLESDRRDFRELRLELPDRELKLRALSHEGQECRNWTGATAEGIAAFVSRYSRQPHFRDFSLHGVVKTVEELDARQRRDDAKSKQSLQVMKWCARAMWGAGLASILIFPWPNSLIMAGMIGLIAWACQWMYRDAVRDVGMRRSNYEAERAAFAQRQA